MRTHAGATPVVAVTLAADPPVVARYCIVTPLPGVTIANTYREFASSDSRNITPAFVHAFTFCTERTRPVRDPSMNDHPVWAKRNWSDVPQMSAPLPVRLVITPSEVKLPPVEPTSAVSHVGLKATVTFENVA